MYAYDFDPAARGDDVVAVRPARPDDFDTFATRAEAIAHGLHLLDRETAINIYKSRYGVRPRFDLTPERIADILADA